jgi:hypothetical protein
MRIKKKALSYFFTPLRTNFEGLTIQGKASPALLKKSRPSFSKRAFVASTLRDPSKFLGGILPGCTCAKALPILNPSPEFVCQPNTEV